MDDDIKTYELRFLGDTPDVDFSDSGVFDTQRSLLNKLDEIDESDFGPLAMGDAEVVVYQGSDVDPMQGVNTVIGKIDAHIAHLQDGFTEEDMSDPGMGDDEKIIAVAHADEFRRGIIDRLTEELGRVPTQSDLDSFMTCLDGALSEEAGMKRDEQQ